MKLRTFRIMYIMLNFPKELHPMPRHDVVHGNQSLQRGRHDKPTSDPWYVWTLVAKVRALEHTEVLAAAKASASPRERVIQSTASPHHQQRERDPQRDAGSRARRKNAEVAIIIRRASAGLESSGERCPQWREHVRKHREYPWRDIRATPDAGHILKDSYTRTSQYVSPIHQLTVQQDHHYNFALSSRGAIAQLGERLHGMQEVGGSIPPGSTKVSAPGLRKWTNRFHSVPIV